MAEKVYTFRAIIESDEPSGYHGYVPSLPGCHTNGETIEEAKENLKDAIIGYLEVALKHNDPIPQDVGIELIQSVTIDKLESKPKIKVAYA